MMTTGNTEKKGTMMTTGNTEKKGTDAHVCSTIEGQ
jgi:hypothetical protein